MPRRAGMALRLWLSLCFALLFALFSTPAQRQGNASSPSALRIGYSISQGTDLALPAVRSLNGGVYLNWAAAPSAADEGLTFLHTVRLHQKLTCPLHSPQAWNREACPYSVPHDFFVWPPLEELPAIARANPGATWLVGNEMDRRDWLGAGQDEMLPELYAEAYHQVWQAIVTADPTAQVGIGGVIQATPLRLAYLSRVWDHYRATFAREMPVDVWNVHNFIMQEVHDGYGADIPPGLPDDAADAVVYDSDWSHIDMLLFDRQIRAMRRWMAERGQQQKPLIVSEYGVLYHHCAEWVWTGSEWRCARDFDDPQVVIDFMLASFDYFLTARDCDIGYVADGCRLVQQWLWYSLDHDPTSSNPHARLFDPATGLPTSAGQAFRSWVVANRAALAQPFPLPEPGVLYLPQIRR